MLLGSGCLISKATDVVPTLTFVPLSGCLSFCFEEGSFEASLSIGGKGWAESILGVTGRSGM